MKKTLLLLLSFALLLSAATSCKTAEKAKSSAYNSPKQEFRGAWVQTVFQDRYSSKTPDQCKRYLSNLVDTLYASGFNAVIFQVRPEGDAFYASNLEPWSRFLTGVQGKAPSANWDPMDYMIQLCHERGMEFHAWINPYRMFASSTLNLARGHLYYQHPEYFVKYGGKLYLNPSRPESRAHIRAVVKDIVSRYDVDAIHMDDYFYPYPVNGESFDDTKAYKEFGPQLGFSANTPADLYDFRRRNVNILIKYVHEDIKSLKPWVRFGVSPFGIYRNKSDRYPEGSETKGTQCYDDLYADVLAWAKWGWVDYLVPQIYWARGYKVADYEILVDWWAKHTPANCQLYIGQSIDKSLDGNKTSLAQSNKEFTAKFKQARSYKNIQGNCIWYAYQVEDNTYNVRDYLSQTIFSTHAMAPAFPGASKSAPSKVSGLQGSLCNVKGSASKALKLTWQQSKDNVRYYNIYRFEKGDKVNIKTMKNIYAHVTGTEYIDYKIQNNQRYTYIVTPVDVYNNEGKAVKSSFKVKY